MDTAGSLASLAVLPQGQLLAAHSILLSPAQPDLNWGLTPLHPAELLASG